MSGSYAPIIARRLCKMIDESDTCEFPSCPALARQLNVSYATVQKAVRILKNEGILSGGKGRHLSIIKAGNIADKKPALSAAGKAVVAIREYMATPEVQEQIRIPVMALVQKLGYSRQAVTAALRQLVKEGAVKKHGRYYAIAPERE